MASFILNVSYRWTHAIGGLCDRLLSLGIMFLRVTHATVCVGESLILNVLNMRCLQGSHVRVSWRQLEGVLEAAGNL